jgi:phosphate transport system protein
MIRTSIQSFRTKDTKMARSLRTEDDQVDLAYKNYMRHLSQDGAIPVRCALASVLVLRYLERIGDHACHIGDSVIYIVTGSKV